MRFVESPGSIFPRDNFGWMTMGWLLVLFFWNARDFVFDVPHDPNHLTICFVSLIALANIVANNRLSSIIRGNEGKGSNT